MPQVHKNITFLSPINLATMAVCVCNSEQRCTFELVKVTLTTRFSFDTE